MIWQDQVIGVIDVLHNVETRRFTQADLDLLTLFANQAAIAVENARLLEAAQRRAEEAETLRQAGAVVTATLRQDEAIENILEQLERVVPYDSASVQLLREGYTEIIGGHGWPDPAAVVGQRLPVPGDNPNTVVIQQRRPYTLGNARTAYPTFREEPHSHIQSWLGVPLIVHDRVIGMLAIESTQPDYFTPNHARLAAAFADQVAIAIENARLYAEVQQLAITDDLTGLYNRRGFFELGRHEVERACRFRRPLAAIMLDLDHLKEVNDTYSHVVGDQVLVGVAACCRQELREVDLLGRCGGDEFVALLPECDLADVKRVAERLRQRIAQTAIETDRGPVTITASLGVAGFDEGCADLEALLSRADQALLYAAKRAGRNQVSVWMDPGER
jgi:diguanylate cyclase (GGDEF)-like protein